MLESLLVAGLLYTSAPALAAGSPASELVRYTLPLLLEIYGSSPRDLDEKQELRQAAAKMLPSDAHPTFEDLLAARFEASRRKALSETLPIDATTGR
jgi:hypothetical protein